MMEMAVVEKLLPGAGESGAVVAADESGERLLPVNRQPLELFEKLAVQQRGVWAIADFYAAALRS